jgi:hypothetical protein
MCGGCKNVLTATDLRDDPINLETTQE